MKKALALFVLAFISHINYGAVKFFVIPQSSQIIAPLILIDRANIDGGCVASSNTGNWVKVGNDAIASFIHSYSSSTEFGLSATIEKVVLDANYGDEEKGNLRYSFRADSLFVYEVNRSSVYFIDNGDCNQDLNDGGFLVTKLYKIYGGKITLNSTNDRKTSKGIFLKLIDLFNFSTGSQIINNDTTTLELKVDESIIGYDGYSFEIERFENKSKTIEINKSKSVSWGSLRSIYAHSINSITIRGTNGDEATIDNLQKGKTSYFYFGNKKAYSVYLEDVNGNELDLIFGGIEVNYIR